jgi:hypothetical protein
MTGLSVYASQQDNLMSRASVITGAPYSGAPQNTGPSTSQLVSGSLGAVSALGSIASGFAQSASLRTEANYLKYEARAAELEGRRQALLELEDFNRSQARRVAAIGASGIGYAGSPITGLEGAEDDARTDINLIKSATKARVAGLKAQAKQVRRSAPFAIFGGFMNAASQAATLGFNMGQR